MEDILRSIFEGNYVVEQPFRNTDEAYQKIDAQTTKLCDDMISKLTDKGVENAELMVDDWINVYNALTREELILMFKKGVSFGFGLAKEIEEL